MTSHTPIPPAAAPRARRLAATLLQAILVAVLVVLGGVAAAQSTGTFTPRDESPEDFPPGPGREDTFYACTACHGFKLVAQQGMSRRQWEESLDWMTEKHGMPQLSGNDRKTVVDYLTSTFPPRPARSVSPNPFLAR